MLVKFQVIHKLDYNNFVSIVEKAIKLVNEKITIDYPPLEEKVELPISYKIVYNKKCSNISLTGVYLDFTKYTDSYYSDYDSTILMGFEWGAGVAIDEFIRYLYMFMEALKSDSSIVKLIKYEDANLQNTYWLFTKEIYNLSIKSYKLISKSSK